jgi:molybdate transport system substrate-binding protein
MPPIEAITQAYEAQTGHLVEISAASSGALNAQIRNGAPFDIYLSANEEFPLQLFAEGIGEEPPFVFASGQLMLWSKKKIPADSLEAFLRKITSQKLAMPDPELAPYGAAAKGWMQSYGLWEKLSPNLIIGNNISHTNQIIRSGSVDYAFTAASARFWGKIGEEGFWNLVTGVKAIPHSLLLLTDKEEGKRFVEFLNSEVGLRILEMYGYIRR